MDQNLECRDCGQSFQFTAQEQAWFAERGLTNPPKRCKVCRASRRGEAPRTFASAMPSREMHPAVCDTCGEQTQVPFRPSGHRPIYCRACMPARR